eukprot:7776640-Pyramimonas_sp.AAC.1
MEHHGHCRPSYHGQGAHTRQIVRNTLRKRPAPTFSEWEHLECILRSENVRKSKFQYDDQCRVSEWLTTALRHKPFGICQLSDMIIWEVTTYDEHGGCAELPQLLNRGPAEGYESHHHMHLDTVRYKLKNQHWAYQAHAVLELVGMVDESGMKQNRLHIKKI